MASAGAAVDFYVDSVNGDDSNNGRTDAQAFKSLAAAASVVQADETIAVKRGSVYRERLAITADNVNVIAYGSIGDADPLIDCSDPIDAGDWTKTGGVTNLYHVALPVEISALASEWPRIWVDGVRLTKAADQATCDSTAGTYWHDTAADVTPLTIYVHPPESSNPTSDGKLYEAAIRPNGIDTFDAERCIIRGIHVRRNYSSYGGITLGRYCKAYDCRCSDGNTHSMFLRAWAEAVDCWCDDCYAPGETPTLFIGFEQSAPADATIKLTRCKMTMPVYTTNVVGTHVHVGGGGASFAEVIYEDCVADKVGVPFQCANADICQVVQGEITEFLTGWKLSVDSEITGLTGYSEVVGAQTTIFDGAGLTYDVDGIDFEFFSTGSIRNSLDGNTLNLTNSRIRGSNVYVNASGADDFTFYSRNNEFLRRIGGGGGGQIYNLPGTGLNLDSDFNDFDGNTTGDFVIGGTTYPDFSAYQPGTGQDANSVN